VIALEVYCCRIVAQAQDQHASPPRKLVAPQTKPRRNSASEQKVLIFQAKSHLAENQSVYGLTFVNAVFFSFAMEYFA
jgi:hypothetical protein